MEFFEALAKRYCHKVAFDPKRAVPEADLKKIVEAGMAAPSAGNSQSPEFIIVNDEALCRRIGEISGNVPLQTAPAMIAVLSQPYMRQVCDIKAECLIADMAVATGYMLLAATFRLLLRMGGRSLHQARNEPGRCRAARHPRRPLARPLRPRGLSRRRRPASPKETL